MTELFARPQAPWALRLVPPFPVIAQRILALVGKEDVEVSALGDLIKMDPSVSAELLRLARAPRPFSLHTSRHLMRLLGKSDDQWRKYLFY